MGNMKKDKDTFFPPKKTVEEMKVEDTVGFTYEEKHWVIKRDE